MASLEGWSSTIELHPRCGRQPSCARGRGGRAPPLLEAADDEREVAVLRVHVPERDSVVVAAQDVGEPGLDVREREPLVGVLDVDAAVERLPEGDRDEVVAEVGDESRRRWRSGRRSRAAAADPRAALREAGLASR